MAWGLTAAAAWCWTMHCWVVVPPPPPAETALTVVSHQTAESRLPSFSAPSPLHSGAVAWLAATTAPPPSKADIQLLRQAFSEFYSPTRNLERSEELLTQAIEQWQGQPADEQAGLYRVRGDCYGAQGDALKAYQDYDKAVQLIETGEGGQNADPFEWLTSVLGRARALKSRVHQAESNNNNQQQQLQRWAQQAAADYEKYLKLASREEWDTDQELIEDGATRNPYAAWEWGSILRRTGNWNQAADAHLLAAQAFLDIGDKPRSVIALLDAGIDYAAAGQVKQAQEVLSEAVAKTPGVEARDVALLQRVVAKEGEGRMALAALLWNNKERSQAEAVLGNACVRLEQLQADAASRSPRPATADPPLTRLVFGIDDDIGPAPLDVSCFRFRNPTFLNQLGWPPELQEKVIKLETLR